LAAIGRRLHVAGGSAKHHDVLIYPLLSLPPGPPGGHRPAVGDENPAWASPSPRLELALDTPMTLGIVSVVAFDVQAAARGNTSRTSCAARCCPCNSEQLKIVAIPRPRLFRRENGEAVFRPDRGAREDRETTSGPAVGSFPVVKSSRRAASGGWPRANSVVCFEKATARSLVGAAPCDPDLISRPKNTPPLAAETISPLRTVRKSGPEAISPFFRPGAARPRCNPLKGGCP
jgi:hypothetical protein